MTHDAALPGRKTIVLIDDDVELAQLLAEYLAQQGIGLVALHSGEEGMARLASLRPDLIILDVMLPGIDGFEVLRRLRSLCTTPVLMLTARGEEIDRIVGLELGADDYLAKPFNPRELCARIRAILRRAEAHARSMHAPRGGERLTVCDVTIDPGAREALRDGEPVRLTATEFELLENLMRCAGRVVDRAEICQRVLGRELDPFDRSLDMHVSHLRKKLGHTHGGVERIKTVRGVGYIYTVPDTGP